MSPLNTQHNKKDTIAGIKQNKAKNNDQVLRYIAELDGEKAKVGLKAVTEENQFYYQSLY